MRDWLKDLKVGDEVIVSWRLGRAIRRVEKITPAGNIKVNGRIFKSNGVERGGDCYNKCCLNEATPEKIKEIKEKIIIQKAINLMHHTSKITLEQANKIIELLDHPTEKGGE